MEKKIATNKSSGAEKVEVVERKKQYADEKEPAKKQEKKPASKEKNSAKERAKAKERAAAKKRVEEAKKKAAKKEEKLMQRAKLKEKKIEKRAELKEKKLEKRTAKQEKKAERIRAKQQKRAELKEKKLKIKADREARRELLKNESKAEKNKRIAREKKERIALKRKRHEARERARENRLKAKEAQRTRRAESRRHKREQKTERKNRTPGFGGWLAAVISLGVASLALATVVTAGAVRMNEINNQIASTYRASIYEMVSVSENMDDSLSKLRVSSGADEQRRLLTDLLVDSELMESALERIPVDGATGTDISSFVNRTAAYARQLLSQLAKGVSLNETQKNTIGYLSEVNSAMYGELSELVMNLEEKDFRAFLSGKESKLKDAFERAGKDTHRESETALDAPFSGKGNVGRNQLEGQEEISEEKASQLVRQYFKDYHVKDVNMTGETLTHGIKLYNYVLTDEDDVEIYAEIASRGGALMFFDTYEICKEKNFDLETCDMLAREYLSSLGIRNVEAAFLSDAGMVADITYVGLTDGVRVYPESIRVRVCESRGRVVGMDASAYLFNHRERSSVTPALSEKQAAKKLSDKLTPYESHLAIVAENGEEALAYVFSCMGEEENYLVYVNADTGEEIALYRIREGEGGRFIR